MSDQQDPPVGYGSPPRHSQFKKGMAPPPRGKKDVGIDIYEFLSKPMDVLEKGKKKKRSVYEIGLVNMANDAIRGKTSKAARFISECQKAGLLDQNVVDDSGPGVVRIPHEYDPEEWIKNFDIYGSPPWPLEDDGQPKIGEIL